MREDDIGQFQPRIDKPSGSNAGDSQSNPENKQEGLERQVVAITGAFPVEKGALTVWFEGQNGKPVMTPMIKTDLDPATITGEMTVLRDGAEIVEVLWQGKSLYEKSAQANGVTPRKELSSRPKSPVIDPGADIEKYPRPIPPKGIEKVKEEDLVPGSRIEADSAFIRGITITPKTLSEFSTLLMNNSISFEIYRTEKVPYLGFILIRGDVSDEINNQLFHVASELNSEWNSGYTVARDKNYYRVS